MPFIMLPRVTDVLRTPCERPRAGDINGDRVDRGETGGEGSSESEAVESSESSTSLNSSSYPLMRATESRPEVLVNGLFHALGPPPSGCIMRKYRDTSLRRMRSNFAS